MFKSITKPYTVDFDLEEAFDGAKRAEEFKFRVKFDQFLGDLHTTLDERSPQGLPASFASPSYGEVMLLFRDKVKDLLKGFTHRLQLAHESFGNVESPDDTAQKVKQDVSRFIEDLIGENLDLTSDEAVSDLSSLSDEASPDQPPSFEDLLAQTVVTKLLENHRKAVRDSLEPANDNDHLNHYNNSIYSNNNGIYNSNHRSFDHLDRHGDDNVDYSRRHLNGSGFTPSTKEYNRVRNFISLDQNFVFDSSLDKRDFQSADGGSRDFRNSSADVRGSASPSRAQHPRDVFGGYRQVSVTSLHTDPSLNVDGGGLYSRTISNQNILNTTSAADKNNVLTPQNRYSSEEDEEGDVNIEDRSSERSRNNSSSSHHHRSKTDKQLSTSSTSSVEPETLIKDLSNHSSSNHNNESSVTEDHIAPTQLDRQEVGPGEYAQEPKSLADPEKDFLELKDFVRRTQEQARPKVQARILEERAEKVEVQEEELLPTSVDRDEEREQFHARYSILDRIHNSEPALPDFSQFDNIDFSSSEIDPDLLSMNLAIIPEETEEELEQEEEDSGEDVDGGNGKWRNNWIFKGKGVSAYDNLGKKKVGRFDQDGPLMMMVPRPEDDFVPKVGNRDVDQLSDFSEGDLLTRSDLDNTDEDDDDDYDDDEDENSFYANTSKELARIAKRRLRSSRHRKNSAGRLESKLIPGLDKDNADLDLDLDSQQDQTLVEDIPGPIVQPVKPEVKLLYDLIPADEDDPKFLTPPESMTIQEGEPVQFTCQVGGTEPYDVFWYREGDEVEELEEGEDVEMGNTGDKYWLTLHHVGHKQAGQYMCIALSDKGKAIQYLVITVKDNKQDLKKPEFLKGLKDVEVTEGESVKFRVKVKGYPQPRVTWFKDGQLLRPSRSCRIEKFGNRDYILTIDYATMDDDAEYTVSARNVAGTEKLSAQVIVEPRSELPPRRQAMSSMNTSAASDSDSDITVGYKRRSYNLANIKQPSPSSPLLVSARRAPSPSSLSSPAKDKQYSEEDGPLSPSQEQEALSQTMSSLIESLPASLTGQVSPRSDMQERENELHINHLDRKVTLTQKRVDEEAEKMQEDSKKLTKMTHTLDDVDDRLASLEVALPSFAAYGRDWALNNRNLWTELNADRGGGGGAKGAPAEDEKVRRPQKASKDIMDAAEEILRLETSPQDPSSNSSKSAEEELQQTGSGSALDLDLPDELEDFPLPGLPAKSKPTPVKSTFTLSVGRKNSTSSSESERTNSGKNGDTDLDDWSGQGKPPGRDKFKPEASVPLTNKNNIVTSTSSAAMPVSPLHQRYLNTGVPSTANLNNLSFDSGQGGSLAGGENSASLASSVSSSTSSLGGGAGEVEEGQLLSPSRVKGRYARDFDVTPTQQQPQQKKKWSVTIDPFSPQAEVVNKQLAVTPEYKHPDVEIHEADISSSSGQFSPSLATPTLARPPPRERAAPVHMVGTSSEAEVPESRTEFNTDGSVELPSVNRLKALFSSNKDDMLGDGNFKR
ncbi:myosin light chain kinase, smooth muscle, partial [Elysia marginata]